jgi:type II secretory pathway pseudopilin PulG
MPGGAIMIQKSSRAGFTLVEMLVSSALIIFMMYIIASAFESGLTSFRVLKAQGDMQEKLRSAASTIRLDLTTPHFGGAMQPSNQGPYLADQRLNDQFWQPPQKGYFRISMPVSPGIAEGVDPDNPQVQYFRPTPATIKDLYLQFTVNLTDGHPQVRDARGRRDQFFQTQFPGLAAYSWPDYNRTDPSYAAGFTSYWAEVAVFAKPNGRFADAAQTIPLYDVYRRQLLLVEPAPPISYPAIHPSTAPPADVSWWSSGASAAGLGQYTPFNGAADVTEPIRRWGAATGGAYGPPASGPFPTIFEEVRSYNLSQSNGGADTYADPRVGGDLLITDVVNFDIKALWEPVRVGGPNTDRFMTPAVKNNVVVTPDYIEPSPSANPNDPARPANPDYPFDYLPFGINPGFNQITPARVFDTWSSNKDVLPPPFGQNQKPYNYGPPDSTGTTLPQGSQSTMLQQELGYWNLGHFTPIQGLTPTTGQPPTYNPTQFSIPLRVRVRALQIKIRIWDQKSGQTRQMTIIQDV